MDTVALFLEAVSRWAAGRRDVRALLLVGSRGRGSARADSDVDLVLVTRQPRRYLSDLAWTERFGTVEKRQVEEYGALTSVRVWYAGGLEAEFGITSRSWLAEPLDEGTRRVLRDGFRVLYACNEGIEGLKKSGQARQPKNGTELGRMKAG